MGTFDKDKPAQSDQALPDVDAIRTNLNALRDCESSFDASPPTNTVAGMLWWATDTKKLRQRNQANDGWALLWFESATDTTTYGPAWYYPTSEDSSDRNIKTHLDKNVTAAVAVHGIQQGAGNGLDADFLDGQHASAFSASGHNHPGGDITSAVANATNAANATDADTVDSIHASATPTANRLLALDGSGKLPASITGTAEGGVGAGSIDQTAIGALAVGQGELKTGTGSGSVTCSNNSTTHEELVAGGMYSFLPQFKMSTTMGNTWSASFNTQGANVRVMNNTSYQTIIAITVQDGSGGPTQYYQNRYVSASGKDHWMFVLYNTRENRIQATWEAQDHPCYGQGANESVIKHPYGDAVNDPDLVIMLIDNAIVSEMKAKRTRSKPALSEILMDQYEIDFGVVRPRYVEREIVELDHYGDLDGVAVRALSDGTILKRRMVTGLDAEVEYRNLKVR